MKSSVKICSSKIVPDSSDYSGVENMNLVHRLSHWSYRFLIKFMILDGSRATNSNTYLRDIRARH